MLSGAVIYAKRLDTLVNFYQLLGYVISEEAEDYCLLTSGSDELALIQTPAFIADNIELSSPAEMRSSTPIKLVFLVDSIVDTASSINRGGGRIDRGQARWEMGSYYVQDAVDPEGNILQLREQMQAG